MVGLTGLSVDEAPSLLPPLLIAALIFFTGPIDVGRAEEILLTVNVKKPVALTSDKFLSYTLDPTVVLTGNALTNYPERSVNMAKALSPAYVRIGGPRSNSYTFARSHRLHREEDPAFTITEANWIELHRWAEDAGLDIVACIAPQHSDIPQRSPTGRDSGWDSRNALDLISFSDHMGFNTSWQLGYECQTRCDISGVDIGRDVLRLRSILDAFPRYSKSIVTGPDVVTYRSKQQQQYLQDYLNLAGNALSAITWHPDFAGVTLDDYGVSMHHDTLAVDRDGLYKVMGRMIAKKPLWLAEAKPEACKKQFLGALVWTRRLGNAARLGAQVIMRQPSDSNLFQPTPDYWVSVLHKSLVGREVLDAKITSGNRTHVHFYCQCTRPSSKYEKGSLTIFGVNLTPTKILINLKGLKVNNIHKYILLPGYDAENRMFSETVLLNNEPLNLMHYNRVPELRPAISTNNKGGSLKLASGGIGFWVLPGLKIKACGGVEDDSTDKMLLRKLTKRIDEPESVEYSVHEDSETEDKDYDSMSMDERRYSTKMSKPKRRRNYYYSEEDESARGYKKYEARMDLERLERLLRRRDSYDDRRSRGRSNHFGFDERTLENLNDNENEYIEEETGEEIRAKLEEYKKRLREYESRNKRIDSRSREKFIEPTETETIDSDKVIEAMQLISKMENAMGNFEKSIDDVSPIGTFDQDFIDDAPELASTNKNINPEDAFLDELLKSKTIKRASVPTKIEDQLRAIYQMLAEEKERRQRNVVETTVTQIPVTQMPVTQPSKTQPTVTRLPITDPSEADSSEPQENDVQPTPSSEKNSTRARRDVSERKFVDDPLGLRKKGLFYRRGRMNDAMRERRIERRNRRRDKGSQAVIFDPKSANENEENYYGFHQRETLRDFPKGDMYFETGEVEVEKTPGDYDYIIDDDEDDEAKEDNGRGSFNRNNRREDKLIEDYNGKLRPVPMEIYENMKMVPVVSRVRDGLAKDEFPKVELIDDKFDNQFHNADKDAVMSYGVIVKERHHDVDEDRRLKESTSRKPNGYYNNQRAHQEEIMDYFDNGRLENLRNPGKTLKPKESMNSRIDDYRRDVQIAKKRAKDLTSNDYDDLTDSDSMHFGRTTADSIEDEEGLGIYESGYRQSPFGSSRRIKRSSGNLEDILDREMIFEDDNNLKDCECRVVRGTGSLEKRNHLKVGELRRSGRRTDRPNCQHIAEMMSERKKQRKREGPPSVKSASPSDGDHIHTTRSKRQVKFTDEEMEDFIDMEPEFVDEESSMTADGEVDNLSDYVEMAIADGHLADDLGIDGVMDLTVEDEDENSGFSHLSKRHNEETTMSSQDHQKTTVGLDSADAGEVKSTEAPVTANDDTVMESLEVMESSRQKVDNDSKEEPQVVKSPVKAVENGDIEGEMEAEKSLVKRANNVVNEKQQATESLVKIVNNIVTKEPEVTEPPEKKVDDYGMEGIVSKEKPELAKSSEKLEDISSNEGPEQSQSPVQLEDITANEEPNTTKFPVKRAYMSKRKVEVAESPVESVNKVETPASKDPSESSIMKLEKTKKPKNSFFRGIKEKKSKKIDQTNTSDSKLLESVEGVQTETSETETSKIIEPRPIQAESKIIEPRSIKPKSTTIEARSIEADSTTIEARSIQADSTTVEPRSIEADSTIAEPRSIEADSTTTEPRSIESHSTTIKPRSIKAKFTTTETRSINAETELAESRSIDAETKIVEPRSIDTENKTVESQPIDAESRIVEPSSIDVSLKTEDSFTTVPIEVTEKPSENIRQNNEENTSDSTKSNVNQKPEASSLEAHIENEDGNGEIKVKRENAETTLDSTISKSLATSADNDQVSKSSISSKDDSKTQKKTLTKPKHIEKITDSVKTREARISARTEAALALKRETDERRMKKSREATSRILAIEHSRNVQKKRADQLDILREKLRQRRAKIMKDSRDEFLDEVEATSNDGEERNLRRREIIEVTEIDEKVPDIVDREKLDYIKSNKPINYEAKKENSDSDVKKGDEKAKKFIPETTEIIRPVHETRERKVNPRKKMIKATNDPELIAYEVTDEIDSKGMRENLQEDADLRNHRVERRDGKSYYAVVESLENPRIYQHQHESQSGEVSSMEMANSAQQNGEEIDNYEDDSDETDHHRDHRRHRKISESNEEEVQRLSSIEYSSALVKNTPNNKYMCLKENSEESPSDNNDELFKLVKENDHYMAMPVQDPKIDDKDKHTSTKKYMKNSDYELRQKYNRPKYARLTMDKTAIVESERTMEKNTEIHEMSDIQENGEQVQTSKKIKKLTRPSNDDIESWLVERDTENSKSENFPVSGEIDLEEALNSSAYELLMLIPVSKNQKRNRQKRQVGNAISRDQKDSILNDTPIEITMENIKIINMTKDDNEDTMMSGMNKFTTEKNDEDMMSNEISTTEVTKIDESGRITFSGILSSNEDEDNSIYGSSSSMEVTGFKLPKGKDRTILEGYANEKIVPSAPKIFSNDPKKSVEEDEYPSLLEVALPRLEASVTTGLDKARRISENLEKFINDFDNSADQEQLELEFEREKSTKLEENVENKSPISSNIFGSTFTNVKKFFDFFTDLVHTFRIN